MKKPLLYIASIFTLGLMSQCTTDGNSTVSINLNDTPLETNSIRGVYVTISGMEYKVNGEWKTVPNFRDPVQVNLLDLEAENSSLLSKFDADAGAYKAMRFTLDAPIEGSTNTSELSFVELSNGSRQPLYAKAGSDLVYEAQGSFDVPYGQDVEVIADFSAPRSISLDETGTQYIIDPDIRVYDANKSGTLKATLTNFTTSGNHTMVYLFPQNTRVSNDLTTRPFSAAQNWGRVENGGFQINAVPVGHYDLYLVALDAEGNAQTVEGEIQSLFIDSGTTTNVTIDGNDL